MFLGGGVVGAVLVDELVIQLLVGLKTKHRRAFQRRRLVW
jgi:hypothetical protein